jgi:hypothetical protein
MSKSKRIKLKRPITADTVRRAVERGMIPTALLRFGFYYLGRTKDSGDEIAVWNGSAFYCIDLDRDEDGEVVARRLLHPEELKSCDDDLTVSAFIPVAEVKPTCKRNFD